MICLFLCHILVQKHELWPHSSPFLYFTRHCPSLSTHGNTVNVTFFFSSFLKNNFCFIYIKQQFPVFQSLIHWYYVFKMITIERLTSQDFLMKNLPLLFIFLELAPCSSLIPLGLKCTVWFQPPNSYLLHVSCLDHRYFIVSITAHTVL